MAQRRKYVLEPEARLALGKDSPEPAWQQVRDQMSYAVEYQHRAGPELA
jgi:hypothetical protein